MLTETESKRTSRDEDKFKAAVNHKIFGFPDGTPSVRQILNKAGFSPADECVLIEVFEHGTRAIGLDEDVDLRKRGVETFWAFRTDRIYRFTVNEQGYEWGAGQISETTLREITHLKPEEILVLEQKEQPDKELCDSDVVDLSAPRTEHLRIEKKLVEVFFKDQPYFLPRGTYTTEELMSKFPIEPGYLLNLQKPDGDLVTLKPGEKIKLECGMKFYSQVPGGGSS